MICRILGFILMAGIFISGCNQVTTQPLVTAKPTGQLTPYQTLTPSPVQPSATIEVVVPETPAPTSTPFLHTITNDDTMLGIAIEYGISLETLQAANPAVDPHFMTVGTQLIIPIEGELPEVVPTATPMPVEWTQPHCYPTGDNGAWCIMSVYNDQETSLENLSAWIGLYDSQGVNFTSQIAYAPLNLLRSDETIALMAYFNPPLPQGFTAHGQLLTALPLALDDTRYLDLQAQVEQIVISDDGMQARVTGEVTLPAETQVPSQIWVLAVGFDSDGNVIGTRKWESTGDLQFDFNLYSLGEKIDRVEVLTEARP